jgi:hypothetical protein
MRKTKKIASHISGNSADIRGASVAYTLMDVIKSADVRKPARYETSWRSKDN